MALWMPTFATDLRKRRDRRAGAQPDQRPLLLSAHERQRQVVDACCERAHAAGVRPGMALTQARAIFDVGTTRIEPAQPDRDRAALRSLAAWTQRFSPITAPQADRVESDTLLIDATGCERVWKGEPNLITRIRTDLTKLGFRSRVAIAPTFAAATAIVRTSPNTESIVHDAQLRQAVDPLPVASLGLDDRTIERLAEVNITRIGELLAIPRSALPVRFGDDLLLTLDRATGRAFEHIEPIRPLPPPDAERRFEGPTTRTDAIERTVRDLIEAVTSELARRGAGARCLEVSLARSDLPPEVIRVTLGRPSREPKHLWTLLAPKLERAHLGFGVEGVLVRAPATGSLRHSQTERWREDEGLPTPALEQRRAEFIDAVSNRLGAERVRVAGSRESHLPERAFLTRPALSDPDRHTTPRSTDGDRPTILFDRPEPAEVVALTPDGPVHRVTWRGEMHDIAHCAGPERLSCEWWRRAGSTRDYFVVRTESGDSLWVCRAIESGKWFVHGTWA